MKISLYLTGILTLLFAAMTGTASAMNQNYFFPTNYYWPHCLRTDMLEARLQTIKRQLPELERQLSNLAKDNNDEESIRACLLRKGIITSFEEEQEIICKRLKELNEQTCSSVATPAPQHTTISTPLRTALSSAFARNKKTIVFSALAAIACTVGTYYFYQWYIKRQNQKTTKSLNKPATLNNDGKN